MKIYTLVRNSLFLAFLPALNAAAQEANSYQDENGIEFVSLDYDVPKGVDYSHWGAGVKGVHYYDEVNTDGYPLAEAAFLQQAGGIYLTALRERLRYDYDDQKSTSTLNFVTLGADYYIPNSIFYVGVGVIASNSKTVFKFDG